MFKASVHKPSMPFKGAAGFLCSRADNGQPKSSGTVYSKGGKIGPEEAFKITSGPSYIFPSTGAALELEAPQ